MTRSATRHAWLRALGPDDMPPQIQLDDGEYRHLRTFKHDFFAATGLYEGPSGRVILKLGRTASALGLPMRWLGRFLAGHELNLYRRVDDLPGVPRCLGGWKDTGLVHLFVEGHPLQKNEQVDDQFFPRLRSLIEQIHARGIAYVDLEKRENILVDDQGRPSLIDFQISWCWPQDHRERSGLMRLIPGPLGRSILARLQQADRYHLLKHQRRHRPDTLTPEQMQASLKVGFWIRLHRLIARPFTRVRRAILKGLTGQARSPKQDGEEFLVAVPDADRSRSASS